MPHIYTGTRDERRERLEKNGLRCDAENRKCVRVAVREYDIVDTTDGVNPAPDATSRTVQSCSGHRRYFTETTRWLVLDTRDIPRRQVSPEEHQRGLALKNLINRLRGRRFRAPGFTTEYLVCKVRVYSDDVYVFNLAGERFKLSDVRLVDDSDRALSEPAGSADKGVLPMSPSLRSILSAARDGRLRPAPGGGAFLSPGPMVPPGTPAQWVEVAELTGGSDPLLSQHFGRAQITLTPAGTARLAALEQSDGLPESSPMTGSHGVKFSG